MEGRLLELEKSLLELEGSLLSHAAWQIEAWVYRESKNTCKAFKFEEDQ